jgi:uncharacterized protein (DUF924 family)
MMDAGDRTRAEALLDFWFGAPGTPEHDRPREIWFTVDPAFDADLRERFLEDQQRAAAGRYDGWASERDPCLALILLLDQLPRNLYRGTPQAFASDAKARATARQAVARGLDRTLPPVRRSFVYLPFEHSEDLADQAQAVRLFAAMPPDKDTDEQLWYARRHYEIIARFGRFPHRNRVLGRVSTPEEEAFLKEPKSSF